MSIEQTDQLIRLILNSVLLVTTCAIVFSALIMRHTAIVNRLRSIQKEYFELFGNLEGHRRVQRVLPLDGRLIQLKIQLRRLRQHYRIAHYSVLAAHSALLFCITSTLVISLRTLLNLNLLIHVALVLFVFGVTALLISIGLTLLDYYTCHHSLWDEINWALSLSLSETASSKLDSSTRRPVPALPTQNRGSQDICLIEK
ncbi:MAG: DUF2721 domain-containing protein [Cyanobacteria bacterium CRU_2_1]|nr:DUF2721 domain-containing protein [Cyanobacteria bacterium CRU_2_1]